MFLLGRSHRGRKRDLLWALEGVSPSIDGNVVIGVLGQFFPEMRDVGIDPSWVNMSTNAIPDEIAKILS